MKLSLDFTAPTENIDAVVPQPRLSSFTESLLCDTSTKGIRRLPITSENNPKTLPSSKSSEDENEAGSQES